MTTEEMMEQSLLKVVRIITTNDNVIEGKVQVFETAYDNDENEASICIITDKRNGICLFKSEIKSIEILPLRSIIRKLRPKHFNFIKNEFSVTKSALLYYSEEQLGEMYDKLCDIECETTPSNGGPLSKRGILSSELVTLLGNEIVKEDGNFDEEAFEKELETCD